MMTSATPMLPQVDRQLPVGVRWFSCGGCVVERGDEREVAVGGILIGQYQKDDIGARNAVLVGLAADPRMHLGQLAQAFGLSEEMVRQIRRRFERDGLSSVVEVRRGGTEAKVGEKLRERLTKLFAAGVSITDAHAQVARRHKISRATVGVVHKVWAGERRKPAEVELATTTPQAAALTLPGLSPSVPAAPAPTLEAVANETAPIERGEIRSDTHVQHAGAWLLVAVVARYGLHELVANIARDEKLDEDAVRVALDSFIIALATGETTVEGVRRLATPSAPTLLRTSRAPSADGVRGTLGRLADESVTRLHLGMTGRYLEAARSDDEPAVFYVDNHLRPYTGQEVVRKGWRMQDKRVLPGTTDHYVHDAEGRPVLRTVSPTHESLTERLLPIADLLRIALGDEQRILLAFDRGGAFPEALAALRDESFEFVTYERRPYREVPAAALDREIVVQRGGRTLRYRFAEFRVRLGGGRGEVRRIALRTDDERQVNLLAISAAPAETLIRILFSRWVQENGLKHGVERWGINQLDGRSTVAYAPDTIIPNPARRRLDNALRLACVTEGLARRDLARLDPGDAKREAIELEIAEAISEQHALVSRRATTPVRAPLGETELAGKLVYHRTEYKAVLDTIRIACANAESDLAETLAPHLPRAAEVKKTLANLFAAPAAVRVGSRTIRVSLQPAGTAAEQAAFAAFFTEINAANLTLPGDRRRRLLRFRSQLP